MLNIIALASKIMAAIALIDKVKTALAAGRPILDVLQEMGAEFVTFFTDVAKTMFPSLNAEQQAAAGVTLLDMPKNKATQSAMNRFQEAGLISFGPPLGVDGYYGTLTKAAVTKFQEKFGLDPDGWTGRVTNAMVEVQLAMLAAPAEMKKALATVVTA